MLWLIGLLTLSGWLAVCFVAWALVRAADLDGLLSRGSRPQRSGEHFEISQAAVRDHRAESGHRSSR